MRFRLPGWLVDDFLRKAVALALAIMIWLSVSSKLEYPEVTLPNLPINVHLDSTVMVLRKPAPTVEVTLSGSSRSLERLSSQDITLDVRLPSNIHEGVYYYAVGLTPKVNVRRRPLGTKVVAIRPDRIELEIDRLVSKRGVKVNVVTAGALRDGYRVVQTAVEPSEITLRGPSRKLLDIKAVDTEPILLNDTVVQTFEESAKLVLADPDIQGPDSVRVSVMVDRPSVSRTLHGIDLALLVAPGGGLRLEGVLPEITITLRGPKAVLDVFSELSATPFLDINAITSPGRYRRPVQVWLERQGEVAVESITPAQVEVTLVPLAGAPPPPPVAPAPVEAAP